jgi:hypothetical protein
MNGPEDVKVEEGERYLSQAGGLTHQQPMEAMVSGAKVHNWKACQVRSHFH